MWSFNDSPKQAKKPRKCVDIRVTTMDADLQFNVSRKAKGRDLFDLVCRTIGLRETWFFGLQYTNNKGYYDWVDFDTKIVSQDVKKSDNGYHFYFLVKFFPEDVSEELIQDITQHLFYLQVKQSIVSMDIYCPPEASVLLASYAVQAKYGDYDDAALKSESLSLDELLPQRVIDQYQMTQEMWEERIKTWWINNKGMSREEAELEYLRIAQDLDMYGIQNFPISNKKESDLWLGVGPLGINVYEKNNKLTPKASFAWSEIQNISFKEKKFVIRTWDKSGATNVTFMSQTVALNKVILDLCIGNHNLYLRRRQPDSLEVQEMKAQSKEEKLRRQAEKQRLEREIGMRLQAEKEKDHLQEEVKMLREQVIIAQDALKRYEETADLLSEKAQVSEEEALVLAKRASEAESEIQRIRISAIKTEEEKILMERKAREAELIATRMLEESENRAKEAAKLKDDLLKSKQAEIQARDKLRELMSNPYTPLYSLNDFERNAMPNIGSVSSLQGAVEFRSFMVGSNAIGVDADHLLPDRDIKSLSEEIEKERTEYLKKSKQLQVQLSELRNEIEGLKIEDHQTEYDRAYQENLQNKADKYATLRKSGAGSTKTRIALFDGL
ncbi:unnamed protein product [Soboliphyme baturini]|uniref:FERM domain-containing protein n=1 Tax=Soboliphyme baturini TaxID=241478 RepID=A0A183IRG8_9BILA|nr:unnamed protein product [Soboliphyme baturini]